MPKFKRPRLPHCPKLDDVRGNLLELNRQIRAARHKYILSCFEASLTLRGKSLARFVSRAAEKMQTNGLYSPTTYVGDIAWSVCRWFSYHEVGTEYHRRSRWWEYRGLTSPIIHQMRKRVGRGRRRSDFREAV